MCLNLKCKSSKFSKVKINDWELVLKSTHNCIRFQKWCKNWYQNSQLYIANYPVSSNFLENSGTIGTNIF